MPCMGPSEPTENHVDKVTQEVVQFLREKYCILDDSGIGGLEKSREKTLLKLREAISDVLFQDSCEKF